MGIRLKIEEYKIIVLNVIMLPVIWETYIVWLYLHISPATRKIIIPVIYPTLFKLNKTNTSDKETCFLYFKM